MPNLDNKLLFIKKLNIFYLLVTLISLSLASFVFHPKIFSLHLTITGGTLIIPFAFFIQDIITEVYGYTKSKKLVNTSIKLLIIYFIILEIIRAYMTLRHSHNKAVFDYLTLTSRHVAAFIGAIFAGLFINNFLLSKSKILFKGKYLGSRFIVCTMIGELAFISFTLLVWHGYLNMFSQVFPLILFSYIYRISFESAVTPLNYMMCNFLKKSEGIDAYDFDISYNPFK